MSRLGSMAPPLKFLATSLFNTALNLYWRSSFRDLIDPPTYESYILTLKYNNSHPRVRTWSWSRRIVRRRTVRRIVRIRWLTWAGWISGVRWIAGSRICLISWLTRVGRLRREFRLRSESRLSRISRLRSESRLSRISRLRSESRLSRISRLIGRLTLRRISETSVRIGGGVETHLCSSYYSIV